jgi:DNA-binding transcriptional LysR family regulator
MNVNLERLIRFYAVADELSFTRAAKRLRVDQPWLSRQIQQLEEQLGLPLFERTTRRIALTREGKKLYEASRELAEVAGKTRSLAGSLVAERRQRLRLGVSRACFWVPAKDVLLDAFRTKFPKSIVETRGDITPALLDALEQHRIDIAIVAHANGLDKFEYRRIHRSVPAILIPQELSIAHTKQIHMQDLAGKPIAVPDRRGNQKSFDEQYQPLLDVGMVPRVVTEGRIAVYHYAVSERLCMLTYEGENVGHHDMVFRRIVDCPSVFEAGIVRNRNDEHYTAERFWSLAMDLLNDMEPVPAVKSDTPAAAERAAASQALGSAS